MRYLAPEEASLLAVYLEAYPGWLSEAEAYDMADVDPTQFRWGTARVLREDGLIERVPDQFVDRQPACRITDAGAVALRERKEHGKHDQEGDHQAAEPRESGT